VKTGDARGDARLDGTGQFGSGGVSGKDQGHEWQDSHWPVL
jgi:hypothetical protein